MKMQILKGHISPETAYIVDDYPYGFRLRCKIRYWLEYHPKRGTRLCSQTTNPKRPEEFWNTPKCSTYCYLAGCMFLDENNHVHWEGLSEYSTAQSSIDWYETYKDGLIPEVLERVEVWIRAKRKLEELRDQGKIEITVTSKPLE